MKKNILYLILFLSTTMVYAQDEYELKDNEDFGYIVDKDGKNTEGIVRLAEDADSPWTNQKKVKFISSAEIDKTKKRQKFKTLDIDDIKEYVAYDDGEKREFKIIKYTNVKEGLSTNTGGLSGGLKTLNNLTKMFQPL